MNNHTLITISRQFGSGGKEIAELVAKKLGIRCFDRQILYLAAEKMGEGDINAEAILNEAYRTAGNSLNAIGENGFMAASHYNKLYKEQAKLIQEIAEKQSAVFLGRCADVILAGKPNCYSFFIYADEAFRAERAKTHYNNSSLKNLNIEDNARKYYYKRYTGKKWGDPQNYDLMINTSRYSLEHAADLIIQYIRSNDTL